MTKNDMIRIGIVVGIVAGVILFGLQYLAQRGQEMHQQMADERAQGKVERIQMASTQILYFKTALDAFQIDVGRYPTTAEGLNALLKKPVSNADGWQQPYLKGSVLRDPWGKDYVYENDGKNYVLYSCGPDRTSATSDDIRGE